IRRLLVLALSSAAALGAISAEVNAATTTSSFTVQVTITASCTIVSTATLNVGGSQGVLASNVDQTTTLQVQCTNTTPYNHRSQRRHRNGSHGGSPADDE